MLEHLNSSALPPRRVVILGAHGFVGAASARLMAAHGVPVLGLGRTEADLLAAGAATRLSHEFRPDDAVVVISARAPCKDAGMLVDNVQMMECVCQALAPVSHVVYISSDAVYRDSRAPLTEKSCALRSCTAPPIPTTVMGPIVSGGSPLPDRTSFSSAKARSSATTCSSMTWPRSSGGC
jgi:nucleoside-diphosphate-sugar epimerase